MKSTCNYEGKGMPCVEPRTYQHPVSGKRDPSLGGQLENSGLMSNPEAQTGSELEAEPSYL